MLYIRAFMMMAIFALSLLACSDHEVYKQSNGSNSNSIYIFSTSNQSAPQLLAYNTDPLVPCGSSSDGRIVFTQITSNGGDIYVINNDGTGLVSVLATPDDEVCAFVTPDNLVIYSDTVPAWNGRHNIRAIPLGSAITQNVAIAPQDQIFKAYAPDKSIIYLRKTSLPAYAYEILSVKPGGNPVMLAQVFPPRYTAPTFNVVTQDNRVIFSEPTEYQQNKLSLNIFAVGTDGSNPRPLAQNPPAQEIFCALTNDNRIVYTEQTVGMVNGAEETTGKLYIVNTDGSNRILLKKGLPNYNDLCVGVTPNNYVIFIRTPNTSRNQGLGSLYSIYADGKSSPILLAAATSTSLTSLTSISNTFEKATPKNRVLFRTVTSQETSTGTTYTASLNSINPDGTGLVSLMKSNYNMVVGVTLSDYVLFNAQVPPQPNSLLAMNLYYLPSTGISPPKAISATTENQELGFIYYH